MAFLGRFIVGFIIGASNVFGMILLLPALILGFCVLAFLVVAFRVLFGGRLRQKW